MRRRSANVQLIAMGTVILGGCSPDVPDDRYVYANHSECVKDWGDANCEHSTVAHGSGGSWGGGGGGGGGFYCYGPRYNTSVRLPSGESVWTGSGERLAVHPTTGKVLGLHTAAVSRGGFGSFARSFSFRGG
jgi:uncharacterized protein YgiB involved in biofilm formation